MAKKKKSAEAAGEAQEGGFDDRLERLEGLVADLEGGELSLEEAMERFAEGVALLGACREALAGYEARVEELSEVAEEGLSELTDEDADE